MTKRIKILLIIFVIISFSSGLTNLLAAFAPNNTNPLFYFFIGFISFTTSYIINEDIIANEPEKNEEL